MTTHPPVHKPKKAKFEFREQWLNAAMPMVRKLFTQHGYAVPVNIRCTCGWPHKNGVGRKKRRIGECWADTCSDDQHFEIFVSPILAEPLKVLGVLVHEVVHAVVGLKAGHRKPFSECAKKIGLTKPWTSTGESDELVAAFKQWLPELGIYPHGKLDYSKHKSPKEGTRLLLLQCECGCKIRTTAKWIEEYGSEWACPCGGTLIEQ